MDSMTLSRNPQRQKIFQDEGTTTKKARFDHAYDTRGDLIHIQSSGRAKGHN